MISLPRAPRTEPTESMDPKESQNLSIPNKATVQQPMDSQTLPVSQVSQDSTYMNKMKCLWLCSPTCLPSNKNYIATYTSVDPCCQQLRPRRHSQGQWWSMSRMQRLQTLQ